MSSPPLVSVLMSVYNGEVYLKEAIDSILSQTFSDFEFIIIDDGSTDRSKEIIASYTDSRITLISRPNKGLVASLNEGIKKSEGTYIARQDADDISLPTRLAIEVEYLESSPTVGLVGSNYITIDEQGGRLSSTRVMTHPDDLKVAEALSNQFGHGSVMMRRSVIDEVGEYDDSVGHVEDYDLFTRISHISKLANISQPLYVWRRNPEGISSSNTEKQTLQAHAIRDREFQYLQEHRWEYKIFSSFHPFSISRNPLHYLDKRSVLFRDLAYLHHQNGSLVRAVGILFLAALFAPWRRRNYIILAALFTGRDIQKVWVYQFI